MKQKYDTYKDSGVEWIGKVPSHWEISKLKYISNIFGRIGYRGYTVDDIVIEGEGAITISPSNIVDDVFNLNEATYLSFEKYYESPEIMIYPSDIIIVKTGSTIGKTTIIPEGTPEMTINPQLIVLKQIKSNSRYLYYQTTCRYIKNSFETEQTGSTTPTISQEKIGNFPVLKPSKEEQQQIVTYLDRKTTIIDELIQKKEQKIALLKEKRVALINHAVTKGLNPDAPMKDSGVEWIGEVPENWDMKRLRHIFSIIKNIAGELGHDVLSVTQQGIKVKDLKSNEGQHSMDYSKYQLVQNGQYIMNHMDLLTGYIDLSNFNGVTSPDYRVFDVLNEEVVDKRYFLYMFQFCYWNKIFYGQGQGVSTMGRWRMPSNNFKNFIVPFPSNQEQHQIVEFLDEQTKIIDSTIKKANQKIELLKEYRQALISEVVTGKIKVNA